MSDVSVDYQDAQDQELDDSRRSFFAKIARLYYMEDMNQRQIAQQLNISVASVSRALSKAKDHNIVKISIDETGAEHHKLEIEVERKYGIRECVTVPRFAESDNPARELAQIVSGLLGRLLNRGSVLGVGWGHIVAGLAAHIGRVGAANVNVVPMVGLQKTQDPAVGANAVAELVADRLDGVPHLVPVAALAESREARRDLFDNPDFDNIRWHWTRLDTALLSVDSLNVARGLVDAGAYSEEAIAKMEQEGAVAALNFTPIKADGTEVSTEDTERVVAVKLRDLRRVPNVVLVSAGHSDPQAVSAALNSGAVDVLVIDPETGQKLC